MGYAVTYPPRCLNLSGDASWAYDTEVSKVAGTFHKWDFNVTQNIYPVGVVSFSFDAYTSGAVGNSLWSFYRNATVESSGQLTAGYLTYSWTKSYTDLKAGDTFTLYVAESAGGGGFSWMRNRKMYILESLFLISDNGT
jgi:hypothetical protein